MPLFTDYQDKLIEMEVSVKLFYQAMTPIERQEMRKLLNLSSETTLMRQDFESSINKLFNNYYSLTEEEIQTLNNISARFL